MRYNKRWSPEEKALPDTRRFVMEDVPVSFIKINRPFPGWRYLPVSQAKLAEKFICQEVKAWGHKPDVIFAFFCYDQWKVIQRVRKHFDCPVVPIFHNCDVKFSQKKVGEILDASPVSGGVSRKILGKMHAARPAAKTFMCYGGAPNDVADYYKGEKNNDVFSIVYAGMLIPLKKVDVTAAMEDALGASVRASSMVYMSPKRLVGSLGSGATPLTTRTAVAGLDASAVTMSCM
jgi:hypothetical protein